MRVGGKGERTIIEEFNYLRVKRKSRYKKIMKTRKREFSIVKRKD